MCVGNACGLPVCPICQQGFLSTIHFLWGVAISGVVTFFGVITMKFKEIKNKLSNFKIWQH